MYTINQLKEAVKTSITLVEVQKKLGYTGKGGGVYAGVKKSISENLIDTSHFKGRSHGTKNKKYSDSEVFIENSNYSNLASLKLRIINDKLLNYECNECGLTKWNNKEISLQLDHINGINTDNRLTNLRFLCPNCHSQTDTFAGKNKNSTLLKINKISNKDKLNKKIEEILKLDITQTNWIELAATILNIKQSNVRRWVRKNCKELIIGDVAQR